MDYNGDVWCQPARLRGMARGYLLFIIPVALVLTVAARAQFGPPPSVLGTTYVTADPSGMKVKVSFHEERGKLTIREEWSNGREATVEIPYQELISVSSVAPMPGGKWSVMVQQKNSGIRYIPFNSQDDAVSVAKYLAQMSGLGSIGDQRVASSVPTPQSSNAPIEEPEKAINCPPGTQIGCSSFTELVQHNDPEIMNYLHPKESNARVQVCFNAEGDNKFFVIKYGSSSTLRKQETILVSEFEAGVQHDFTFANLHWISEDFGQIAALVSDESQSGSITDSELEFRRTFTNLSGTKTTYALSVRWSTGKYLERYSWPDKKGEIRLRTSAGSCIRVK